MTLLATEKTGCKSIFLLFALFLFGVASPAAGQYRVDTWTTDNGLPQGSVNAIVQTRDGFLWFATFGGLVRYDGVRFQVFNTGNTKGLRSGRFTSLFEDREGNLWSATESQGLTRYRDEVFTTYTTDDGLPSNQVFEVAEDLGGNLLVRWHQGIVQWKDGRFIPYPSQPGEPVTGRLRRTKSGAIWFIQNSLIRKYENGHITDEIKPGFDPRQLFEDSLGRLWIGTGEDCLLMYQNKKLKIYSEKEGYPQFHLTSCFEDKQGTIWFSTNKKGLIEFKNGKFTAYTAQDGLARGLVGPVYQDREGTLWVGADSGLSRLTQRVVTPYARPNGLAADNIYPIYQDHAGTIWIGSWPGLTRYVNGTFTDVSRQYGLTEQLVTSLMEDSAGGLWIGTWGSGIIYARNGKTTLYPESVAAFAHTRAIIQDRAGDIWFGSVDGLARYHDGKFVTYQAREGMTGREVQTLYEDRRGRIWIGADNGLTKFENGKFTLYTEKDGITNNILRSIYEDADGVLWIGMYDTGLYRFKDERFVHYTTREGLFDNGVFRIIEDKQGSFWISCNLGIYRVRKDELNAIAAGRLRTTVAVPYNKRDGMLNSECNGGGQPAGIMTSDGHLWFPTQGGVAVIDPERVPVNQQPPLVVIESFVVDTKPVSARGPLRIEPGQVNVEIHYSGLSFINPELIKFKYKLEGLDTDWVDAGTRRTAYYAHLPPGTYAFKVMAANRDGVWNEGAIMQVVVRPRFWRTWWFISLIVCSLGVIAFLLYRRRITQLERARKVQESFSNQLIESQERERRRIAAELHDSLGQSLLIIKNRAYLGLNQNGDPAVARQQLEEISESVSEALQEVREISYYLRPAQLERLGLTTTLEEMLERVSTSSDINFSYQVASLDGALSADAEINFIRIVQESINNIIKHSRASEANIAISRGPHSVHLVVSDNGRGFVPAEASDNGKRQHSFGLIGLAERVRILGGSHLVRSAPGAGTTISVTIKSR
jgi:signal transduction histidine kinase/ligand-binding sensor domain-containing protein